jgi:hypothetical protein
VVKAIKAARKAKLQIAAIRIEPDGTILIVPGTPQRVEAPNPFDDANDWDQPNPLDEEFGTHPPHSPGHPGPRRRRGIKL